MNKTNGLNEIPALPFCHSGMTVSNLPPPIGSLNAITASETSGLRFAFNSIQAAVGGRGSLRTNFDNLSSDIRRFENKYTVLDKLRQFSRIIGISPEAVAQQIRQSAISGEISLGELHFTETQLEQLKELERSGLRGIVRLKPQGFQTVVSDEFAKTGPVAIVFCKAESIIQLVASK